MNLKVILILLLSLIAIQSQAQSRYNVIYEQQLSQNFAAENFNAGLHLINYLDTLVIPKKIIKKNDVAAKVINPLYRLSKLFFLNYLITDFALTMNHERYGHGYRILDADGEIVEIEYNLPPPFTDNEFSWITVNYNTNHSTQQTLGFLAGGSEANLVLSDVLRKNILLDERFSYTYALPYLYANNDAPGYTAFVTNPNADPIRYRNIINDFYGGERLTGRKMKTYSFIALLTDPMNFYALKATFFDYLIKGNHSSKVGMITFSNRVKYLPRFRFEYTPYGPELVIQNYLKLDSKLFQFSYAHSDGTFDPSWRITAEAWNIHATDKLSFNFKTQFWNQPEIDFFKNDKPITSVGFGAQIIAVTNYDFISKKHILGATIHLGYKTKGYSLGEQLDEGLIVRGGLTFRLRNKRQ